MKLEHALWVSVTIALAGVAALAGACKWFDSVSLDAQIVDAALGSGLIGLL